MVRALNQPPRRILLCCHVVIINLSCKQVFILYICITYSCVCVCVCVLSGERRTKPVWWCALGPVGETGAEAFRFVVRASNSVCVCLSLSVSLCLSVSLSLSLSLYVCVCVSLCVC